SFKIHSIPIHTSIERDDVRWSRINAVVSVRLSTQKERNGSMPMKTLRTSLGVYTSTL
ncbi:unnamed protein product, partial [Arabidopsis halleri]